MTKHQFLLITSLVVVLVIMLAVVIFVRYYLNPEVAPIDTLFSGSENGVFVDSAGSPVSFEAYEENVRVINSWATWTPFSVEELQNLNTVAGEYKDRGVVVLAINRDEPPERIEAFLMTLPPLPNITFIRDTEDMLYANSAGYTMPETLFYDNEGNLVTHKRGQLSLDEMRAEIESSLKTQ